MSKLNSLCFPCDNLILSQYYRISYLVKVSCVEAGDEEQEVTAEYAGLVGAEGPRQEVHEPIVGEKLMETEYAEQALWTEMFEL